MARVELIMPKMGESVSEATIITWTKEVGEHVELDETIVEIATDKVDSEVPSTHEGKLVEKLFAEDDLVQVGEAFAILEVDGGDDTNDSPQTEEKAVAVKENIPAEAEAIEEKIEEVIEEIIEAEKTAPIANSGDRFYSPLVRSMASKENIGTDELNSIPGTGKDGRVSKADMTNIVNWRNSVKEDFKAREGQNITFTPCLLYTSDAADE